MFLSVQNKTLFHYLFYWKHPLGKWVFFIGYFCPYLYNCNQISLFFSFFLFAYHVHSHSLIMQWVSCDEDLRFSNKWSKPETEWKRKQMKEIFTNSGLNVSIKKRLAPVDFTWFYFLLYLKLLSPYMINF